MVVGNDVVVLEVDADVFGGHVVVVVVVGGGGGARIFFVEVTVVLVPTTSRATKSWRAVRSAKTVR